jgi:hypothetical protein
MNATELDISAIIGSDEFCPFDLSNNRATLGDNAGALTWAASKECAEAIALLDCEEKKEAFRSFVADSGGWNEEEVSAWDDNELNALLLQWIAGDIREAFGDAEPSEWDWAEYEAACEAGRVSSRIYKGDDGKVYFSISN